MTISTYTDLLSNIDNWLARTDLDAYTPTLVQMFEAYANRKLRVAQMETSTALTTSTGTANLPSDYLGFRSVTYNGQDTDELAYVTPTELRGRFPNTDSGTPVVFTIENTTLSARPVDDTTTITLRYYQTIPALVTNSVNWLLTAHPDLYLFGSLTEAAGLVIDPDKLQMWKARRDEVCQEITDLDYATKGGGNIRPIGWVV